MKKGLLTKSIISLLLCVLIAGQACIIDNSFRNDASAMSTPAPRKVYSDSDFAINGTFNVSTTATVTIADSLDFKPMGWYFENIHDGNYWPDCGWTTDANVYQPNVNAHVSIDFNLHARYDINRIVLAKMGLEPECFEIQVSLDGKSYTTVHTQTGFKFIDLVHIIDITSVKAQYVRFYITKLNSMYVEKAGYLAQLGEIAIFGKPSDEVDTIADIGTYAPPNSANIALHAELTCNDSFESPADTWSLSYIQDGSAIGDKGFSTSPFVVRDALSPCQLDYTFDTMYEIERIVFFPRGLYPKNFKVQVEDIDGKYIDIYTATNCPQVPTEPIIVDFNEYIEAKKLRVLVTERYSVPNVEHLVQFAEIAIYGIHESTTLRTDKMELIYSKGETDKLEIITQKRSFDTLPFDVEAYSENTNVVTFDKSGNLKAIANGKTNIVLMDKNRGKLFKTEVVVSDDKGFQISDDNIMISTFLPPYNQFMTEENIRLLKEANVDYLQYAHNYLDMQDIYDYSALLSKYGMQMGVVDSEFQNDLFATATDEQLVNLIDKYKNLQGIGGVYLRDEPFAVNSYARPYNVMHDYFPDYYYHVCFFPNCAATYNDENVLFYKMLDYLGLTGEQQYVIADYYPFWNDKDRSCDYKVYFSNLDITRRAGLRSNTKTGCYLQICGYGATADGFYLKRTPNQNEIRYNTLVSLAYGMKQMSYMAWMTPDDNTSEIFQTSAIDRNNQPTSTYYAIKNVNVEAKKCGKVLVNCDAKEVYQTNAEHGQAIVPNDFFVNFNKKADVTVSYLEHKKDGSKYMMIVNNDYAKEQEVTMTYNKNVGAVSLFNLTLGDFIQTTSVTPKDTTFKLEPGAAILYKYNSTAQIATTSQNSNFALNKMVYSNSSVGNDTFVGDGWYLACLTDGVVSNPKSEYQGWKTQSFDNANEKVYVTVDLGENKKFNKIQLFPTSKTNLFPKSFTIDVSKDNKNWTTIKSLSGYTDVTKAQTYHTNTVNARYLRISINEMNAEGGLYSAHLGEITATYTGTDSAQVYLDVNHSEINKNLITMPHSSKSLSGGGSVNYDPDTGIITVNGSVNHGGVVVDFSSIDVEVGEKYTISYDYISGSVSSVSGMVMPFAFTENAVTAGDYARNEFVDLFPTQDKTYAINVTNGTSDGYYVHVYSMDSSAVAFNNLKFKLKLEKADSATEYTQNAMKVTPLKSTYQNLPTLQRDGYDFLGWYTEPVEGGTKITNGQTVTNYSDHTLYARWLSKKPEIVLGDVTGDGEVRMRDVVTIQRSIVKFTKLTDEQALAADVNHDEAVGMKDVVLIQRYIAKLITAF